MQGYVFLNAEYILKNGLKIIYHLPLTTYHSLLKI